mgnify:CR=1 FL=1
MKNRHLEHPEDAILNEGRAGFYNVLDFLEQQKSKVTVKYDGSPAIVWGINPENNKFFVGTKSVFNKVRVKINYTHYDIEVNHGDIPAVASILHMCLEKLPRVEGVYQGDFIGYGGGKDYTPNTITYKLDDIVREDIIVAAHTTYNGDTIKDMCASFGCDPIASEEVKFLDTSARFKSRSYRIGLYIAAARVAAKWIKFPTEEQGRQLKTYINSYIRMGLPLDAAKIGKETKFDKSLFQLYNFIIEIKNMIMEGIDSNEDIDCFLDDEKSDHEGFVLSNEYGTYKLVNREQFSYANFNLKKNRDK